MAAADAPGARNIAGEIARGLPSTFLPVRRRRLAATAAAAGTHPEPSNELLERT